MSCAALRHAHKRRQQSLTNRHVCGKNFLRATLPMPGWRPTPNIWQGKSAPRPQSGLLPPGARPTIPFSTKGARLPCERSLLSAPRWHSSAGIFSRPRSIFRWHFGPAGRRNPQRKNGRPTRNASGVFGKRAAMSWRPCESWRGSASGDLSPRFGRRLGRTQGQFARETNSVCAENHYAHTELIRRKTGLIP